ncbi:2734_t:CDS:10, partial [Acaulospora morrowiae]
MYREQRNQRYSSSKVYYSGGEDDKIWIECFHDIDEKYEFAHNYEEPEEFEPAEGIEALLDPSALKQLRLTDADKTIKVKDLPERMLLRPDIVADRKLTDKEIDEAAKIICDNLVEYDGRRKTQQLFVAIKRVLKCLGQEFLEVPYIYAYRRDYIAEFHSDFSVSHEIIDRADLWHVYDLEYQYRLFIEKRESIEEMLSKYQIDDDYVTDVLVSASNLESLSDLHEYIHHRFWKEIAAAKSESSTTRRRLKRTTFYESCFNRGLHKLVECMGVDVEKFGRSFIDERLKYYRPSESRLDSLIEEQFSVNPAEDLADAVKMLSQDIAFNPLFRKYVRQYYLRHSVIVVRSVKSIGETDPCWPFRFLRKHISKFKNSGLFSEIMSAEKRGQVKVTIALEHEEDFMGTFEKHITNNSTELDRSWNKYRVDAVNQAFINMLRPMMELWIKSRLTNDAEQWIMAETMKSLENRLNIRPFRSARMDSDEIPRVAALSWGPGGRRETECVCIDENGKLIEKLGFSDLRNRDIKEFHEFVRFLRENKPRAIVVRCYDGRTKFLLET